MSLQKFQIDNFLGEQSSSITPPKNASEICKNFDVRNEDGALVVRPGYDKKYPAPIPGATLSSVTFLSAENFYVPEIGGGSEVTVIVGKGTIAGQTGDFYTTPASINSLLMWIRPYWNGSSWVDAWLWLNQILITKIQVVNADKYKLKLDFEDAGIISNTSLDKWTVYNLTKGETAKIVKTYDYGSGVVGIKITNNSHSWAAQDVLYIMKNYVPISYLLEMYNATAGEVAFHKILNDLRIGFGGKESRLGLSIGHRKKYFKLDSFEFGGADTDITAGQEEFMELDEICLDPYNITTDEGVYSFDVTTGVGDLDAGTYHFRMIAVLDGFNAYMVAEKKFTIGTGSSLLITPRLKLEAINKRLTHLRLYVSKTDTNEEDPINPFFLITDYAISSTTFESGDWKIGEDGIYFLDETVDLHSDSNAASIGSEADATTGWTSTFTLSSSATFAQSGTKSLKMLNDAGSTLDGYATYSKSGLFLVGNTYRVTVYLRTDNADPLRVDVIPATLPSITDSRTGGNLTAGAWAKFQFTFATLSTISKLHVYATDLNNTSSLYIDSVSIELVTGKGFAKAEFDNASEELNDSLGYEATTDFIKSWDQVIVTQGRAFYINPYISERILNKVFLSPFSGAGAPLYDVGIADSELYHDLENFDGNSVVGMEVLSNMDFLAAKSNSIQIVDSRYGNSKRIEFGKGCVSRRGMVNLGDAVIYPGEYDLLLADAGAVRDITDGNIRMKYRAIANKENIIAIREEKDNAYRFFTGDTVNKTEYVITKKGIISAQRIHYPEKYITAKDGSVWFLNAGALYYDNNIEGDAKQPIIFQWRSVKQDVALLQGIPGQFRFYINSVFCLYSSSLVSDFNIKVYCDGNLFDTVVCDNSGYVRQPLKLGGNCRSFKLEISGEDEIGESLTVHSIGVFYSLIPVGYRAV